MKHTLKNWLDECRKLRGNPRYIARGMAIGIFVSMTPFFPFQTAVAVAIAVMLRGSKRASAIGVWLSNPLTFPICYYAIYKVGMIILRDDTVYNPQWKTFADILQMGLDVAIAMVIGGSVLGCVLAIPAYYITKRMFMRIRKRSAHS